jgi:transcriptional regulator with XRE-family HTH domain
MTMIRIWSGREVRALREARRMSQRDFAAHLGVNWRMIAKWEAGGENIKPRPVNQSALDSSLATAPPDVHARFAELLDSMPAIGRTWKAPEINVASPSRPTLISRAGESESSEMAAGGLPDLSQFELLRQEMNDALGQSAISAASIDDWERTVIRYGRVTRDRPARILQADLSRDLTELTRLLSQRSSASALRRLTRVTAQMSGLMCLIFCLLDDRTAFRSWARTARIAAAEAGDPETLSWVLAQ